MPKTYRGKLPDPDSRGYIRPEIGGKRFTVGNINRDSQGEMRRRRDAVADLFDLQCQQTGEGRWMEPFLGFAKKLVSGQRLKLSVSDYARTNAGQASEEAQGLAMFREMGLDIVPDDPLTIAKGEAELKKMIDDKVRSAFASRVEGIEGYDDEGGASRFFYVPKASKKCRTGNTVLATLTQPTRSRRAESIPFLLRV